MRKGISQLTLTLILSALTVVTVIGMGRTLRDHLSDRSAHYTFPNLNNPSDSSIFITTLLLVLISGMIARAIYAHLKFLSVLAIFIILIGVTWSLDAILAQLLMLAVELGKTREYVSSPSSTDMLRRAMMLLVEFPIFIVGMLLGRYLSRSVQRSAPKRIMRIRRKRRKRTRRLD